MSDTQAADEVLMDAQQIADAIGSKASTVLSWRKEGIIPAEICRGKFIRFSLTKVREALRKDADSQVIR